MNGDQMPDVDGEQYDFIDYTAIVQGNPFIGR